MDDCWPWTVTEEEQAEYLKTGFDIMLQEVKLPDYPDRPAITKVFWYTYRDEGLPREAVCPHGVLATQARHGHLPPSNRIGQNLQLQQSEVISWWFGIRTGAPEEAPKLAQCAYKAYPFECGQTLYPIYLPTFIK